jgi:hypothetical protein
MTNKEPRPKIDLLPGEKVELYVTRVTYSIKATGALKYSDTPTTKLIVTNKRILISYGGVFSDRFAANLVLFYTKNDFDNYKKIFRSNYVLEKFSSGKSCITLSFSGLLFNEDLTLYTKQSNAILKVLKKNSK